MRSSSRSWPSRARCRSSSDRWRSPASSRALSSGSSSLTAAATARWRLTSRSLGSRSLVRFSIRCRSRVPAQILSLGGDGLIGPPHPLVALRASRDLPTQWGGLGNYGLDDCDRPIGSPIRDLDAPRELVEEHVKCLAVGIELGERLLD